MLTSLLAFDSSSSDVFSALVYPINQLLNTVTTPLLAVVTAVGVIWCILLGVRYAKAEDPQERKKAKDNIIHAIIGFVLIFVLIATLNVASTILTNWMNSVNT